MSEQNSKQNNSTSSEAASVTTTTASSNVIPLRRHITQNFLLIWLDANIDQLNKYYQNTLAQLDISVTAVTAVTHGHGHGHGRESRS